jgi:CYTH domain-containing protein
MKKPENELKFVLRTVFDESALTGWKRTDLKQGYLPDGWRLRDENGEYTRTMKIWSDAMNAMDEDENDISREEFESGWPDCGDKLQKTRYKKQIGDEEWVVDFFRKDNGEVYFVMAEVEMPVGREAPLSMPKAIEDYIVYRPDKTDPRFLSKNLADPQQAVLVYNIIQDLGP